MAIKTINVKGRVAPIFVCDVCGQRIKGDGIIQLFRDGHIKMVHKNYGGFNCDDHNDEEGTYDLANFMHYLVHNSGVDMEVTRNNHQALNSMG